MGKQQDTTLDQHVSGQANGNGLSKPAHALTFTQVTEDIKANAENGLSSAEAKERHSKYGTNELGDAGGVEPGKILIRQIANAMTLVLIMAMVVSFAIKSWIEGGVVAAVIGLNIVIGFMQEFKAEKTMDSLKSLSSPTANAVRDGKTVNIPTVEIVPGDMVEIKTGDTVPADVRLIEAVNFETDEALLTGESLPVRKDADAVFDEDTGPGDRLNVAYSSSVVTKGRARGIVYATGMYTEIGSIAAALRKKDSRVRPVKRKPDGSAKPHRYAQAWTLTLSDAIGRFLGINVGTPLQKQLSRLAVLLFFVAVICAIIVEAANNFSSQQEVIIYAVATGLSMIPASLVVILTICMAAGTKRMVERHVIVRNLRSLEALGGVTDICSDKTGTLTQGKMMAKKAWIPAKGTYSIGETDETSNPTVGELQFSPEEPRNIKAGEEKHDVVTYDDELKDNEHLEHFLRVAALDNLAIVQKDEDDKWTARGDPTEIAIQVFAARFGWNKSTFVSGNKPMWKEVAEFPFDSDVKKMSVIFEEAATGQKQVFTKGAVERVIGSCINLYQDESGNPVEMTEAIQAEILQNMEAIASLGLRCLALASKDFEGEINKDEEVDRNSIENGLTFRGLVGLYDPPRPESASSVRQAHEAGIIVHMLTGDHKGTAQAIAADVGILPTHMKDLSKEVLDAIVMEASVFDKLSDDEIDALPVLPLVVARCAPNTKVRMIEALHRRKAFAAMTGDGVNDSPSLKRADVGIAMGQSGSDVAKDASDIVLTDDNFASILNAVEEGRRMFDNIQKFILHLLSQNIAQACILLIGLVFKDLDDLSVFPISPVEIMWIIMITSSFPDMGLSFEEAVPDVMRRPPQSLKRGVFTFEVLLDMLVYGLWVAALCLCSFCLVLYGFEDGNIGRIPATGCNNSWSSECDVVFRARSTCFATLTWFSLFLAWEMIDPRRSFFRMKPDSDRYFTQWMFDVWRNKFLFTAVVAGFVLIFPVLYIPVINHDVFRHTGISWEWGIVFIATLIFFIGIESWKWAKRIYFRHQAAKAGAEAQDIEAAIFGKYMRDLTPVGSWSQSTMKEEA
ncbi:Na(+)/Li(+)-exporting P-type ATPase, partial [Aureobasidium melanogenum]